MIYQSLTIKQKLQVQRFINKVNTDLLQMRIQEISNRFLVPDLMVDDDPETVTEAIFALLDNEGPVSLFGGLLTMDKDDLNIETKFDYLTGIVKTYFLPNLAKIFQLIEQCAVMISSSIGELDDSLTGFTNPLFNKVFDLTRSKSNNSHELPFTTITFLAAIQSIYPTKDIGRKFYENADYFKSADAVKYLDGIIKNTDGTLPAMVRVYDDADSNLMHLVVKDEGVCVVFDRHNKTLEVSLHPAFPKARDILRVVDPKNVFI